MDSVKLRDTLLFPQDENHSVVAETTTRVDRDGGRLVDHEHFTVIHQNLERFANHGWLMPVDSVSHEVIILWVAGKNKNKKTSQQRGDVSP